MADLTKTVSILFQGVDDVSGTIKSIGRSLDDFGGDLEKIGDPFAAVTQQILAVSAAIAGIAAAGIAVSATIEAESKKMASSLGLTNDEAERFKDIALDAYQAGFGEDLAAAFEAVGLAQKKFGDDAAVDIGKVTEQALILQGVFGTDFNGSLGAVRTLMQNFGVTAEEAFDFIAKGFQTGLDGSGDFIESINEYSTQFSNGGADAVQFFSVLQSGFQEGMLGTDRAADLFKEFRVRIQDGSKTTKEALESIGIDPVAFGENLASGKTSAIEAFDIIQLKLNETTDRSVQLNAGVGLMGTQFEDLGTAAALAIDTTNTKMEDLAGTINSINPDDFQRNFTSALRTIATEFGSMPEWDVAKERLSVLFQDIAASFGPALEGADFSGLMDSIEELYQAVAGIFTDVDLDLTSVEGMENAVQLVIDSVESLTDVVGGVVTALTPVAAAVLAVVRAFNDLPKEVQGAAGVILGIGTALTGVGAALSVGGVLVSSIGTFTALFSSGGALAAGITGLVTLLTGPVGLAVAIGAAAAAVASFSTKHMNDEHAAAIAAIDAEIDATKILLDQIQELDSTAATADIFVAIESGDLEGAQKLIDDLTAQEHDVKVKAEFDSAGLDVLQAKLDGIPDEKIVEYTAAIDAGEWAKALQIIEDVTGDKTVIIDPEVDATSLATATEEIAWFDDEGNRHTILVDVETDGLVEVKEDIEEIPTEKLIEIKLQGEIDTQIAQIIASADVAEAAFKYNAELDIAQLQANADVAIAAFESIGGSVEALTQSTASMFSALVGNWNELSQFDQNVLTREVEKQAALQEKALEAQIKLNEAQVKNLESITEARDRGDAAIIIESSGLEPSLEMIMWEILEKVQVRATESSADFLLGIN